MAKITLKGNTIHTSGNLPAAGSKANDFVLVNNGLERVSLANFKGVKLVLNVFPSLDTGTCAMSVRHFNKIASELPGAKVLCISRDLPFAQKRFCGAEGLDNVMTLSDFETGGFGKSYGLEIADGPLKGLHSRCVIIVGENGDILYTQQVPEITEEPDYADVLKNLKQAKVK